MDSLPFIAKFGILISAVLTAGGALATVLCHLPARSNLQRFGALIGITSSAIYFSSQASVLTGRWDGVFMPGMASLIWQGGAGPIILFLAASFALFLFQAKNSAVLLVKSIALLLALTMLSHLDGFLKPVLFIHLLMALIWAGVILPFLGQMTSAALQEKARRFGQIGVVILPILFIAGVGLVWLRTEGALTRLWGNWGLVLLLKLGLVSVAALVGLRNKLKIVPYISDEPSSADLKFRSAMILDVFIFIAILGISAVLGNSSPG